MIRRLWFFCVFVLVSACAGSGSITDLPPSGVGDVYSVPEEVEPEPLPLWTAVPRPIAYDALPGWDQASIVPGLNALRQSCAKFANAQPTKLFSNASPWAGSASDWGPACAALDVIEDAESARTVLQALFLPLEVRDTQGAPRFTGYFEPTIEASRTYAPPYTEPIAARPADLVERNGKVYQRRSNGRLRAYPTRKDITRRGVEALAYARPADVFFLQIQGSGRLIYPDGTVIRAAYAATNGQPFRSTANWLMRKGWISRAEANMAGIKAWMARASERQVRTAMNANPRFVFFRLETIENPALGPKGSYEVPLTPLGSMAVDQRYHVAGLPMFVQTTAPGLGGTWSGLVVAQDTGGAIKGPVRGDLFFGTGPAAGAAADTVNAPGRLWIFLPRSLAERLNPNAAPAT